MSEEIKEYKGAEVTVVWKPKLCMHSEKCFHGLSSVFNPVNRPWVNINGADSKSIINQVATCPSGALSIKEEDPKTINENQVSIELSKNGPYLVKGVINIKLSDGEIVKKSSITALCRCGGSANKPFCDGTHSKIGFEG